MSSVEWQRCIRAVVFRIERRLGSARPLSWPENRVARKLARSCVVSRAAMANVWLENNLRVVWAVVFLVFANRLIVYTSTLVPLLQ
jgi:hypothetical protein